jgi:hypothetical protein
MRRRRVYLEAEASRRRNVCRTYARPSAGRKDNECRQVVTTDCFSFFCTLNCFFWFISGHGLAAKQFNLWSRFSSWFVTYHTKVR